MRLILLAGLAALTISTGAPSARADEALVEQVQAPTMIEMRSGGFDWSGDKGDKPRRPRPKPGPRDEGDGD